MSKSFEEILKQLDIVEEGSIRVSDMKAAYNAGMERAAEIAENKFIEDDYYQNSKPTDCLAEWIAAAIREEI